MSTSQLSAFGTLALPLPANSQWFCFQATRLHSAAVSALQPYSEVFNPQVLVRKERCYQTLLWPQPLFPRYVFARTTAELIQNTIARKRDKLSPVMLAGSYATVPVDVIEEIRSRTDKRGYIRVAPEFHVKQKAEIAAGPLKGLRGIIQRIVSGADDAETRVILLLTLLGRVHEMELSETEVKRVV